jgi:hypothetical protein
MGSTLPRGKTQSRSGAQGATAQNPIAHAHHRQVEQLAAACTLAPRLALNSQAAHET